MEYRQPTPALDSTPTLKPMGFTNAGVTCWWNSLLQTMLSLRRLTEVALRYRDILCAPLPAAAGETAGTKYANPIAAAYIAVLDAHIEGKPIGNLHLDLLKLFNDGLALSGKTILSAKAQECANEAFVKFIEMFSFDPIERMFLHVYSPTFECGGCKKRMQMPQDHHLQVQMVPPIAPPAPTPESYREAYNKWVYRLQVDVSELDNYKCDSCNHNTKKAFRVSTMHAVHDIITVIFPQFIGTKQINWFPAEFRLSRAAELNTPSGVRVVEKGWWVYRIRSAMHHSGTADSGHHFAVCERARRPVDGVTYANADYTCGKYGDPANALYRIDDMSVLCIQKQKISPSPYIYMVVYELVHEE